MLAAQPMHCLREKPRIAHVIFILQDYHWIIYDNNMGNSWHGLEEVGFDYPSGVVWDYLLLWMASNTTLIGPRARLAHFEWPSHNHQFWHLLSIYCATKMLKNMKLACEIYCPALSAAQSSQHRRIWLLQQCNLCHLKGLQFCIFITDSTLRQWGATSD